MSIPPTRAENILKKAEYIENCLDILTSKQSASPDEYVSDFELKDIVERRFVKMTQACIDIARMILKDLGGEIPKTNSDTMRRLASEDVIYSETSELMATACGLRNVLAHKYGTVIDDGMVYDALQDLSRYRNSWMISEVFLLKVVILIDVLEYISKFKMSLP